MARPPKEKQVSDALATDYFRPVGVPLHKLERVYLSAEELEALNLVDAKGLSQTQAAQLMGVHQSTIARILARAQKKLATALIDGKALVLSNQTL